MIFAYIRVSTAEQTVENQKHEILSHGYQIDKWYQDDGVSGTVDYHKRQLNPLLKQLKEGDTLICSELSRLGRSLFMIFEILHEISEKKVNLITIKENFKLDNSINSKVISFAFGLSAEIERNLISQRTKEALALRKAQGIKLGRPVGRKNKEHRLHKKHDKIVNYVKRGKSRYYITKHLHCNTASLNAYLHIIQNEIPQNKFAMYGLM